MRTKQNTIIYLPGGLDATDRWAVVAAALKAAGVHDIRPAPLPAQAFQPRHARPVLLSSREV